MNKGITQIIGDKSDVVSVVIGESKIGAAIHFHALGNLLRFCSELIDVDDEIMRSAHSKLAPLQRGTLELYQTPIVISA